MRRRFGVLFGGFIALVCISAQAKPVIDRDLVRFAKKNGRDTARVIVMVKTEKMAHKPRRYDGREIVGFLKARSERVHARVRDELRSIDSSEIRVVNSHWIVDAFTADVTAKGLKALARMKSVERIYLDRKIGYDKPGNVRKLNRRELSRARAGEWPYDLVDIGIDRVQSELPDVNGDGVVIGSVDTGVDANHPALKGKIVGFWDANGSKEPHDESSHGTHTIGTMIAGDRNEVKVGIAPAAKMISAAALTGYDEMLKGMEFMLDPDGDAKTEDFPRAINNSWNTNGAPDQELFYRAIEAWEAAGILPVFSAGNAGPGNKTITHPHEHPSVIATAATDQNSKVASFSSRGPADFKGKEIQKPDVSAPGVDIISSVPGGSMQAMSGTSMAAPHVTGVAALLFQVNPKFNPQQVREVLVKSSTFVNENGEPTTSQIWSKTYGFGRLNAFKAVQASINIRRHGRANFDVASVMSPFGFLAARNDASVADDLIEKKVFSPSPFVPERTGWVAADAVWSDL